MQAFSSSTTAVLELFWTTFGRLHATQKYIAQKRALGASWGPSWKPKLGLSWRQNGPKCGTTDVLGVPISTCFLIGC